MMDEPRYTSTRTDPETYADKALFDMRGILDKLSDRRRGYVRDELREAFEMGEHQGECRAIVILAIAKAHARSDETRAAIEACLRLLVDE